MNNKAMPSLVLFTVMMALPQSGLRGEEPLPPRALARIGDHRFYHGPEIMCAVLSPDGRCIASGARDPVIVLWDAATGERLRAMRVPQGNSWCLAFSPNGKRLAAAYGNSLGKFGVAIFEAETGKLLRQLEDFKMQAAYLQFSADGKQLRVSELDGPVSAWDAATGKQLRLWKPPFEAPPKEEREKARGVLGRLSPDGKVVAWEMNFHAEGLRVHDANTDELLYQKKLKNFKSSAFSSDGKRLAALAAHDDKLRVWEAATGKELAVLEIPQMVEFALTPDGRHAVIREKHHRLRLWDLERGKPLRDLYRDFAPLSYGFSETQTFSADGAILLQITESTLRLLDTRTGKEWAASSHRAPITPRFSTDGRTLFTSCSERRCSWDISREEPALLTHEPRKVWEIGCLAHSADERLFLDYREDRFRVRETATGRVLCELEHDDQIILFGQFPGQLSPDATRVMLGEAKDPQMFRLYDAKTGKRSGQIKPADQASDPVFSPNGRLVAWTDRTNAVHLHDAVTGKVVRTLRSPRPLPKTTFASAVLFSPDGEYLLAEGGYPQPMRVFHISSGREIIRFDADPEAASSPIQLLILISCVAWSPDGRLLAVAEAHSGAIRLIEIASGKARLVFAGHCHGVHGLAFAPDGRTLASGGEDNVVFLWDVTGARLPVAVKKTLAEWWTDLTSEDAKQAGVAIAGLLRKPEASVTFLQERLRPVETPNEKHLTQLLADLDSNAFHKREAASRELTQLGELAEAPLRQALKERPSLEMRRRLEALLDKLEPGPPTPETLRTLRAIEILEHVGTPEARSCLDVLAKGAPQARQTHEAKRALDRLVKRR